jgi:hypothetical protein
MNDRLKIVESTKSQKNATIATVAKATGIDRTAVRYHLKVLARHGFVKLGRGTAGPNGSAPVSIIDAKQATAFATDFEPRARNGRRAKIAKKSLGGGKRGKRQNGIGTSPKRANGHDSETFLVTCDVLSDGKVVHSVGVYHDKEQAIASAVANEGAVIWAARKLSVVHTLQDG